MVLALFGLDDGPGGGDGGPDVGVARGERGQAEPEAVRGAVVGDDVRRGEQLDEPFSLRVAVRDVAAAAAAVPRGGQGAAERLQPGIPQLDEIAGPLLALDPHRARAALEQPPGARL